jgi:hypothetical protein
MNVLEIFFVRVALKDEDLGRVCVRNGNLIRQRAWFLLLDMFGQRRPAVQEYISVRDTLEFSPNYELPHPLPAVCMIRTPYIDVP